MRRRADDSDSRMLRAAVMEVVENQIRSLDPPETKETFDRLVSEGLSKAEAKRLIGAVVVTFIFGILRERRPYEHRAYVKALRALPRLPGE